MFFYQKSQKFHEKKAKNYRLCKEVTLCFRLRMWLRSYDFPDFESNFWFSSNQQPFENTDSYANSMSLINVVSNSISILETRDFYLKSNAIFQILYTKLVVRKDTSARPTENL